ncbi:putative receptor-like protein kinase [Platanthera guangdongensis]|uniref:Receptor-like protein kinase n=1 Tax=Platanthera guangdongensis TaxID=2320717 RepID=A0ABR2MDC3_9ASPA
MDASSECILSRLLPPPLPPSSLYQTARVFTSLCSYEFHITSKGNHIIRLHFYPFSTPTHELMSAQFHAFSSGFVLLTNFTASFESPSIKEFIIRVDDEKAVIFFAPADSSSFALVNDIEVISAPGELIGDTVRLLQPDEILKFDGLSKQAMATLFRINVGSLKVTPFNDTLWRTWIPDISAATGQVLASCYYVDFVADVGSSGILHVTVGCLREVKFGE